MGKWGERQTLMKTIKKKRKESNSTDLKCPNFGWLPHDRTPPTPPTSPKKRSLS